MKEKLQALKSEEMSKNYHPKLQGWPFVILIDLGWSGVDSFYLLSIWGWFGFNRLLHFDSPTKPKRNELDSDPPTQPQSN